MDHPPIASADLAECLSLLAAAEALSPEDPMRAALERAVTSLAKSAKKKRRIARRQANRQAKSEHAPAVSARAEKMSTSAPDMGTFKPAPAPRAPPDRGRELSRDQRRYVGKGPYRTVHAFDHSPIASADLAKCLSVLAAAEALSPEDPMRAALARASAALTKSAKRKRRLARKQAKSEHAPAVSARAERMLTSAPDVGTREPAPPPRPPADRRCYVCKVLYRTVHAFYHWLSGKRLR